jgi:hypothetical protein
VECMKINFLNFVKNNCWQYKINDI